MSASVPGPERIFTTSLSAEYMVVCCAYVERVEFSPDAVGEAVCAVVCFVSADAVSDSPVIASVTAFSSSSFSTEKLYTESSTAFSRVVLLSVMVPVMT